MNMAPDIEMLRQLALDLRWSWSHATDELWKQIEPDLWARTHNPWVVMRTVSYQRLAQILANPGFRGALERHMQEAREAEQASTWFQQAHPDSALTRVAYFSMEFMLSEVLPIYAGGLGNVAGDQLKAASDLGVPVVGVGLLYQQGYFRQVIDRDGAQQALYPYNDPGQLPVTPVTTTGWRMAAAGDSHARLQSLAARLAGEGRPACTCTCSTATTSPITPLAAASRASSTAAAPNCGCSRKSCSASAAGGCSRP